MEAQLKISTVIIEDRVKNNLERKMKKSKAMERKGKGKLVDESAYLKTQWDAHNFSFNKVPTFSAPSHG